MRTRTRPPEGLSKPAWELLVKLHADGPANQGPAVGRYQRALTVRDARHEQVDQRVMAALLVTGWARAKGARPHLKYEITAAGTALVTANRPHDETE
jgi:hypothetical protein